MSQDTLSFKPCIAFFLSYTETSQFMAIQLTAIRDLHTIAEMPHKNGVGNKIFNVLLLRSIVYSITIE